MVKVLTRKLDVRRRQREEGLVLSGRCPDCRRFVQDPAWNRCHRHWRSNSRHRHAPESVVVAVDDRRAQLAGSRMTFFTTAVKRFGRLRNVAGANGLPLLPTSVLADRPFLQRNEAEVVRRIKPTDD